MSSTELQTPIGRKFLALFYGVLCHALFALAVAVMIYEMYFGLSRARGTLHAPWSWLGNGLLILQFPLAHSFLLTGRGRTVLRALAPAGVGTQLATTSYVIVASAQILLLFEWWSPSGVIWWQAQGGMLPVMIALYTAGWLLLVKAMFDAGITVQIGSLGWWSVYRNAKPVFPPMPARGLFRICRQPIYVAFAITLWTVPVWTPDQLVLAIALTSYCLAGPLLKEARFSRMFGSEFEAYRARHPYWLPFPRAREPQFAPAAEPPCGLSIYERDAEHWWDGSQRWLRALQNLVPARLAFFDRLTEWHGRTVLDLGCGGGFMSEALAARGADVIGVDLSRGAISAAKNHAAASGLSIRYLVGSGDHLPLPDNSADCLVCVDVLEHVRNVDNVHNVNDVLDEIRRVLRPNGVFLFDTINRTPLARFVIVFCGERILRLLPQGTHDPAQFIAPAELDAKLAARGFVDRVFEGLGPRGINRRLDITFGRLPSKQIMYMGYARLGQKNRGRLRRRPR
jgi:ubiquinone biosynthesis O-methyltransferase